MMPTREQSLQAMKEAGISLTSEHMRLGSVLPLINRLESLEATKRQLILAEFATRLSIRPLKSLVLPYADFEDELWAQFQQDGELSNRMCKVKYLLKIPADAQMKYYAYVRSMFAKSAKTREDFYNNMLLESGINVELGGIGFGEKAAAFEVEAMGSVHQEHLLVWYSVRLLLLAWKTFHPGCPPIAENGLETLYKHFENEIPLCEKFSTYSESISHFEPDVRLRLLPSLG